MSFKEWVVFTGALAAGISGAAMIVYLLNKLGAAMVGAW